MNGLKVKASELDFFQGARLMQVCIGQNELILRFDNNASVTVMSEVACHYSNETFVIFSEFPRGATVVCNFLGRQVSLQSILDAGRKLELAFSDESLVIIDNSDQFESFVIEFNGATFVA